MILKIRVGFSRATWLCAEWQEGETDSLHLKCFFCESGGSFKEPNESFFLEGKCLGSSFHLVTQVFVNDSYFTQSLFYFCVYTVFTLLLPLLICIWHHVRRGLLRTLHLYVSPFLLLSYLFSTKNPIMHFGWLGVSNTEKTNKRNGPLRQNKDAHITFKDACIRDRCVVLWT